MSSTREIDALIEMMAKLPGLGPRSARRAVLHLIRKRALLLTPLSDAMQQVAATARECLNCSNIATGDLCPICRDERRANGQICVVEDVADLLVALGIHTETFEHVVGVPAVHPVLLDVVGDAAELESQRFRVRFVGEQQIEIDQLA